MNRSAERACSPNRAEALRNALARLELLDARRACIARLRLVGRLSTGEIASLLGFEEPTVAKGWRFARAWLAREMSGSGL